jgi:hypothetical protein
MTLQKPDGDIHPILCGEAWRRCFASLAVNVTPIHNEAAKLFTSSYENFIQTTGIRDGSSHCAKTLTCFYDNLDVSDPTDPEVIIKIDVANAFNCDNLSTLFGYFKAIRTCETKLRYFDWDGQVHIVKDKTDGQQGDPLEMLIFNLTVHHIWGRVLAKFQGVRTVSYADDGYIKGKLSEALRVLTELKHVLKEDEGLELDISKTDILPKDITQHPAGYL